MYKERGKKNRYTKQQIYMQFQIKSMNRLKLRDDSREKQDKIQD